MKQLHMLGPPPPSSHASQVYYIQPARYLKDIQKQPNHNSSRELAVWRLNRDTNELELEPYDEPKRGDGWFRVSAVIRHCCCNLLQNRM